MTFPLLETATAIAGHLANGWTAEADKEGTDIKTFSRVFLCHPDGRKLDIVEKEGKLHIGTTYPRDGNGAWISAHDVKTYDERKQGEMKDSIKVSAERGAKVAAREIERRLLPVYDDLYARVLKVIKSRAEYRDETESNAERLAACIPGGSVYRQQQGDTQLFVRGCTHTLRVSGDNVRFEHFDISITLAMEVVKVLCGKRQP